MKNFKDNIAIFFVLLTLFNSCAVYQGSYSLNDAVDNGKKVKIKTQYNKFLVYNGNRYEYTKIDDCDTWEITKKSDAFDLDDNFPLANDKFPFIIISNGYYYGIFDLNNWDYKVNINSSEIIEVPKTKNYFFTKIIHQKDEYWGIVKDSEDTDLVPINEDQIIKVSQYDPMLSVLASILITPVVIGILLLTPVEDDW